MTDTAEVLNSTAQTQIRSVIDRVNRLEIEKEEVSAQIKDVYSEAKANGLDTKILRKVVRELKKDRAKRQEEATIMDLYMHAAGEGPAFEPARADTSLGVVSITVTTESGAEDTVTPDTLAVGERIKRGADAEQALYDQAVALVLRDGKASVSYIQRRLQLNYNHGAAIMERMEREGVVGPPNHAGKREILQKEAA